MLNLKNISIYALLCFFFSCGSKFSNQDKIRVYNYYAKKAKSNNAMANYKEALAQSNLALEITDTLANAYRTKGIALYHLNHLDAALKNFDNVISIEGICSKTLKNRALAHLKNNDGYFLNDIETYLKQHPNDEEAMLLRSNYYDDAMSFSREMTFLHIDFP